MPFFKILFLRHNICEIIYFFMTAELSTVHVPLPFSQSRACLQPFLAGLPTETRTYPVSFYWLEQQRH